MKISIVTPSFNSDRHIRDTILSVISQQGNFSIEYIVVDNCSTDNTKNIVESFQRLLKQGDFPIGCNEVHLSLISDPDRGMYDAINKGFEDASGDVFAWINADDVYLSGAFAAIAKVFLTYEDLHWVKGITSYITESSSIYTSGKCNLYTQNWIKAGVYGRDSYFIQQDSVFWRAWLWKKCGGIDSNFKRAGDYYLWVKFAEFAPLVSIRAWVSCFRKVEGQLSQDMATYMKEVRGFSSGDDRLSVGVRFFLKHEKRFPHFLKPHFFRWMFGSPEFSVVLLGSDDNLSKISGKYYEMLNAV